MKRTDATSRNEEGIRQLLTSGRYPLYAAVVESGSYFVLNVLLARAVDSAIFGDIVSAMVAANIFHAVTEGGLSVYFQREAARCGTDVAGPLRTGLVIRAWSFLPFAAAFVVYGAVSDVIAPTSAGIAAVMLFLAGVGQLLGRLLYGLSRYRPSFRALAFGRCVSLSLALAASFSGGSAGGILTGFTAGIVLQLALQWRAVRQAGVVIPFAAERGLIGEILSASVPMGIGLVFVWMYDKSDVLVVRHLLDSAAVSYYAVAYTVYKVPQIVTGAVLVPLFTRLSGRYAKDGMLRYADLLLPTALLTVAAAFSMTALWWGSGPFIREVYGESYAGSSTITMVLLLAVPGVFLNNLTGVTLNAVRLERSVMVTAALAFAVNVAANLTLVPYLGVTGAAVSTIITEYVMLTAHLLIMAWTPRLRARHGTFADERGR